MPTALLCSLGSTWAIVPEAFHHLPPGAQGYSAVHVISSNTDLTRRTAAQVRDYFADRHPSVVLTITHVEGFTDLRNADDHARFEEALLRWILDRAPDPTLRHICLAGGFKTMSAAMQRAAHLLGASAVFHVLADSSVNTPELIDQAAAAKQIAYIHLDPEPGWPALRQLTARDFPLITCSPDVINFVGYDLSNHAKDLTAAQQNLATHFSKLGSLPFPSLALLPPTRLAWLNQPFKPTQAGDLAWLRARPKIELHCHLGGFATGGSELDAIRAAAANPATLPALSARNPPSDWPIPAHPIGLEPYRHLGDNNGSALLRDPGCLRAQCTSLYAHFVDQNILYAEVRCSPANYASFGRSPWQVLADIRDTFQACMDASSASRPDQAPACHVNLLIIGTRQTEGDYRAGIALHLALALSAAQHWTDDSYCRVVGVDLAGFEDPTTRAHYFREEFVGVHRCGLALTVHAGENDDAEGVWRAVFDLNARRLGHALALAQSSALLQSVADRAVAVEMCPYANLQIKGFPIDEATRTATFKERYPLLDYLRAGVRVTVNTDNIGISAASLTDNLVLAARLCPGLTRLDLLQLQRHALEAAFISPAIRNRLLRRFSAATTCS
jgi:adenosine deaminase